MTSPVYFSPVNFLCQHTINIWKY